MVVISLAGIKDAGNINKSGIRTLIAAPSKKSVIKIFLPFSGTVDNKTINASASTLKINKNCTGFSL